MPAPLEEYVRQVLLENNRGAQFYDAVHSAWDAVAENYPQRHRWRRKSTLREIMWEEAIDHLIQVASNDNDIQVINHKDTISFIVEDAVLIRLKCAKPSLATSNYPTAEALAFDDHEVDLYGYTDLQRVELCYVPDQFDSSIMWVGVSARENGRHLWKIELDNVGAVAAPELLPFGKETSDTAELAKLKNPAKEQSKEDKKKDNG